VLQVIGVNTQPVAGTQEGVSQKLPLLHTIGVYVHPEPATPTVQESVVQALLSLQIEGQMQVALQEQNPKQATPQGVAGITAQVETIN